MSYRAHTLEALADDAPTSGSTQPVKQGQRAKNSPKSALSKPHVSQGVCGMAQQPSEKVDGSTLITITVKTLDAKVLKVQIDRNVCFEYHRFYK